MNALCPHCKGTVTGRRGRDPLIDYFWLGCRGVPDKKKGGRGMTLRCWHCDSAITYVAGQWVHTSTRAAHCNPPSLDPRRFVACPRVDEEAA